MAGGARDARDPKPRRGELGRVPREETAAVGIDDAVSGEPDDAAVVGVPVALLPHHRHLHGRG